MAALNVRAHARVCVCALVSFGSETLRQLFREILVLFYARVFILLVVAQLSGFRFIFAANFVF